MKLVPNTISRSVARQILTTKKNSPHIFFVAGIAGSIATVVLSSKATLKAQPVVEEIKGELADIKEMYEDPNLVTTKEVQKDKAKDLLSAYGNASLKLGRLYGPSILVGTASIGALTGSHVQLTRRNSALTATLGVLTKAYDEYRQRVRDDVGEERELDIFHGLKTENRTVDGKKQQVKVLGDPSQRSMYARIFDETNPNWERDPERNRIFVTCQQTYVNHLLRARGHVFLNDVYDALGFERSREGAIVGWVINSDVGDNYIDFGMFEAESSRFVNGIERSIILDFNVDGVVYDQI